MMRFSIGSKFGVLFSLLFFCFYSVTASGSYLEYDSVRKFIDEISARHQLDAGELRSMFDKIERQDKVIESISRPAERVLQWKDYRPIFISDKRVDGGVKFWRENRDVLERAEREYGVPVSIIVAIIGVESFYGRHKGRYSALASLATLAFDYPPRSKFFRSELEHFLLLAKEESFDPLAIKGSYAAAMGMPQFISSSYRHYAVDFDGDGRRDLWSNIADVSGSVANYFRRQGWRSGEPVVEKVNPAGDRYVKLITSGLKPSVSSGQLQAAGIELSQSAPGNKSLMQLMGNEGEELWVGHKNFYVITRYNHSKLYAMVVYQLSMLVEAAIVGQL
jgi:membrane-bound lytic murein transglycosylase B